jgi:DNA-binding response OmpR family regulator
MSSHLVLSIDDDTVNQVLIQSLMDQNGFRCVTALSGQEGLQILATKFREIDCILLDVLMPGMNGYEVATAIRTLYGSIPIIMISSLNTVEDKMKGLNVLVDDYLTKPLDKDELIARILNNCRGRVKEFDAMNASRNDTNISEGSRIKTGVVKLNLKVKEIEKYREFLEKFEDYTLISANENSLIAMIPAEDEKMDSLEQLVRSYEAELGIETEVIEEAELMKIGGNLKLNISKPKDEDLVVMKSSEIQNFQDHLNKFTVLSSFDQPVTRTDFGDLFAWASTKNKELMAETLERLVDILGEKTFGGAGDESTEETLAIEKDIEVLNKRREVLTQIFKWFRDVSPKLHEIDAEISRMKSTNDTMTAEIRENEVFKKKSEISIFNDIAKLTVMRAKKKALEQLKVEALTQI